MEITESAPMTVGELKKRLEEFDDDLPVVAYTALSEDGTFVDDVYLEEDDGKKIQGHPIYPTYFKGDHPFRFSEFRKAVFIKGW